MCLLCCLTASATVPSWSAAATGLRLLSHGCVNVCAAEQSAAPGMCAHPGQPADQRQPGGCGGLLHPHHQGRLSPRHLALCSSGPMHVLLCSSCHGLVIAHCSASRLLDMSALGLCCASCDMCPGSDAPATAWHLGLATQHGKSCKRLQSATSPDSYHGFLCMSCRVAHMRCTKSYQAGTSANPAAWGIALL